MVLCYKVAVIALVCFIHSITVFGQEQQGGPECFLPRRTGMCSQTIVRYYFNEGAGQCVQFLYTGCGGNLNNFLTKEDCQQRCLCSRPVQEGTGTARLTRYYYNVKLEQCVQFRYRGTGGNANRFFNIQACENKCVKDTVRQQCEQRPDNGFACGTPATQQVYYDNVSNVCREFTYNGCGGNSNRFSTVESCSQTCKVETQFVLRPDKCYYQPVYGDCNGTNIRYYYNTAADQCQMFLYSGCGGAPSYSTLDKCNDKCVVNQPNTATRSVKENTKLKGALDLAKLLDISGMKKGAKRNAILKLAKQAELTGANDVDSLLKLAKQSGMMSAFKRSNRSKRINEKTTTASPTPTTTTMAPTTTEAPVVPSVCLPAPEEGDCIFNLSRYYFDTDLGMCRQFSWSGCGGNSNRFYSKAHCESTCVSN